MASKEKLKEQLAEVEKKLEGLKATDKSYDKLWQRKQELNRAIKNAKD